MLKQQIQIILDTVSAHQRSVGFLSALQEPIQPTIVVDPSKRAFHFPPLPTIALLLPVFGRASPGNADMVLAIGNNRNDPSLAQGAAQRFTIVALVQSQAFGTPPPLPDPNAIHSFQNIDLIIPMGAAQREIQRMPVGLDDNMPFEA